MRRYAVIAMFVAAFALVLSAGSGCARQADTTGVGSSVGAAGASGASTSAAAPGAAGAPAGAKASRSSTMPTAASGAAPGTKAPKGNGNVTAVVPTGKVTLAQYAKVAKGMSFKQVLTILGPPRVNTGTAKVAGKTMSYFQWFGASPGSSISIVMSNDKVMAKQQKGLK